MLIEVLEDGQTRLEGSARSSVTGARLRSQFKIQPGSSVVILVGKDGTEKLRKTTAQLGELFTLIDAMPMRQREMREQ